MSRYRWMVAMGVGRFLTRRLRLGDCLDIRLVKKAKSACVDLPPPRGVLGCGASTIARPGV
jgi:hypothetical protein